MRKYNFMTVPGLILATIALISMAASTAYAQTSRLYAAGYLGLNLPTASDFSEKSTPISGSMDFKNATSFAGALGVRLTPKWRVEGEISYRKIDMDTVDFGNAGAFKLGGELKTYLYMINGFYDFDFEWDKVSPYLTAGIGMAQHDGEIDDISGLAVDAADDSFEFAWQVGGGMKYRIRPNMAFIGDYRYLATTNADFENYEFEYGSHEVRIGVQYDLPTSWTK